MSQVTIKRANVIKRDHATYAITEVDDLPSDQRIAIKTLQANGYIFGDAANGYTHFGNEEVNPNERIFRFSDPYGSDWVFMRADELFTEASLYNRPPSNRRSKRTPLTPFFIR
jgi:hypothetical protein